MIAMVQPLTAVLMIGFTAIMIISVVAYEFRKDRP